MKFNPKKLLKPRVFIWAGVSLLLAGVLIAANAVAVGEYGSLIDSVLGGKRAITAPRDKSDPSYKTKEQAYNNGNAVTQEICNEGMILLKNENNALPLNKGAKVSVFGKNSTDYTRTLADGSKETVGIVTGGSGSAAPTDAERKTIYEALEAAGFSYNPKLKDFYASSASGNGRSSNPGMEHGDIPTLETGETPISNYTDDIKSSYDEYGDAAIVVFSRIAGENWDLPRKAADDANRHYLELDNNERDLLRHIASSGKFQRIILLLNGSNYIDLGFLYERTNATDYNDFGKDIDAVINIGSVGGFGIMSLGKILSGDVNPSGHTVDLVYTDYKNDPTWQNFGGNFVKNGDNYLNGDTNKGSAYYLVEYEENIYMGYRYYETRGKDNEVWYNSNVVYPFGYGLSYTEFSQELVNKTALEADALTKDGTFEVEVKVKNTGDVAGKQVIQLYAEAPYTSGGIEKAYKVLVGFAKTKLLAKDEEETVTITVDPYDFASFDSHDKNNNGFKGYELEKGNYIFHVATDSHTDFATFTKNMVNDAKFEKDPDTGYEVKPLFDEVTAHMNPNESLSRANFEGTFPKTITDAERTVNADFFNILKSYATTNDEQYDKVPKMNAPVTVAFTELVGADYNDPLWNKFLDQMTFDEMLNLFNEGCYKTLDIERLGIPATLSSDGPTGLVCFLNNMSPFGDPLVYGTAYYQSECLLAQTYNVELAEKQGHAIGDEGVCGNERDEKSQVPYPGWYAPGVNLHRSPFSGRNTEYYSEDPFLTGTFAAQVIKSVQEKGVYANVKHFALNDQETHRSANGISTWCDEQAMRELYLKAFEKAVKDGKSHGLMTSFNRIGTEWAGGSYRLCTTILRKEWGFEGSVICDYHTDKYMDSKQMLYAGGDLNLCSTNSIMLKKGEKDNQVLPENAKDVEMLRRSAHSNLFAIVNSCAMGVEIIGYKTAVWRVVLTAATWSIVGIIAVWGFLTIFLLLRKKDDAVNEKPVEVNESAEPNSTEKTE